MCRLIPVTFYVLLDAMEKTEHCAFVFLACIVLYLFLSAIYLTFVRLSYFSDHFLKLKIYYGELNFEVIEEEEAYTVNICIIGKLEYKSHSALTSVK